jgi:hypothetical protein
MFDGMEHVNLYSPTTIEMISKQVNFSVQSVESIIDELGPINNFLGYEDPYAGSFTVRNEFDWINADHIHKNFLGYKLQIVLKPN